MSDEDEWSCIDPTCWCNREVPEPSPSHRQRTDDPPTDEELDEWVKGLRKADYL